jgi:predicted transcriptional regulator
MAGHRKILELDASAADDHAVLVLKALASDWRLRILRELGTQTRSIAQLATALGIPAVTTTMHVKALEEANLIVTKLVPASRGLQKVCSRTYDQIVIALPSLDPETVDAVEIAMPIGAFVDIDAVPTCGLATDRALVGMLDDPASFFEPERVDAQILWFRHGWVDYRFPYRVPPGAEPLGVQVRMEICSEAPMHNDDCPSDITLWVNGIEIGTWTSPGDFGGDRGALTPSWWLDADSQFGLHKRWEINPAGSFLDGVQISDVTLQELHLRPDRPVAVRIGVKPDARNVNGINIFGRKFGNYPEDIVLRIAYERGRRDAPPVIEP